MDEMALTRLMKELIKLLQNTSGSEGDDETNLDERVKGIKRELGSWFIEGYPLYQAS